jgi:hypothetical protein
MTKEALPESLLKAFRDLEPRAAFDLIVDIAAYWGTSVAERNEHEDARIIASKVRNQLNDRARADDSPNCPSVFGGRRASRAETDELAREWAERLVKLPEDDALAAFCDAFWEWLLTADLSSYLEVGDTNYLVVGRVLRYWSDQLGV